MITHVAPSKEFHKFKFAITGDPVAYDGSDGTLRGGGCAGGTIPVAPSRRAIASVSRRVACAGDHDHDRGNADEERVAVSNRAVVVTGRACGRPESLHCPLDPAPARDQ